MKGLKLYRQNKDGQIINLFNDDVADIYEGKIVKPSETTIMAKDNYAPSMYLDPSRYTKIRDYFDKNRADYVSKAGSRRNWDNEEYKLAKQLFDDNSMTKGQETGRNKRGHSVVTNVLPGFSYEGIEELTQAYKDFLKDKYGPIDREFSDVYRLMRDEDVDDPTGIEDMLWYASVHLMPAGKTDDKVILSLLDFDPDQVVNLNDQLTGGYKLEQDDAMEKQLKEYMIERLFTADDFKDRADMKNKIRPFLMTNDQVLKEMGGKPIESDAAVKTIKNYVSDIRMKNIIKGVSYGL